MIKMLNDKTKSEIKILNNCGIGVSKLRQVYHCSPNTIQEVLGKSANNKDIHKNINKVYNAHLISDIEYFVDSSQNKRRGLKTHDRKTLKNFPKMYFVANNKGKLISYYLEHAKSEYAFHYLQCIIKANLPKSTVIHVDIYSIWLFKQLESRGYKVCHINKRIRLDKLNIPYAQQVEHLFANIQTCVRRIKAFDVTKLTRQQAEQVVIGLIWLYHKNQQHRYLAIVNDIIALKNKVLVK